MGRKNYLIDTNIAIYYFGLLLSSNSEAFLDEILKNKYYISVINRIELLGSKNLGKTEQKALYSFIENAEILNLDEEIILKTINIRKKYAVKLPDAIIGASCIVNNCELLTNNIKDFAKIDGLITLQVELLKFS